MRQLKLALRTLFKTPFVTVVAIVSLALGIGANAAIFSLFDQMLLKPLPVPAPRELVSLTAPGPKPGSTSCNQAGNCSAVFSYGMFRDLEREQQVLTGLAAHRTFGANLSYEGQTTAEDGMLVSGSYFQVLGLVPAAGRLFGPQDDGAIGQSQVVVLSHDFWRRRFNQNPGILNETMIVNGQSMTVVGVAPDGFTGTTLGTRPTVFVPLTMRGLMQPGFVREDYNGFEDRRSYWVYLFGRLRPGVSMEQAATGINGPYRNLINELEAPLQTGMSDQAMAQFRAKQVGLEEGSRGQSNLHANAQVPLLLLLTVTGVVLLIACANIANLLLARAAGRAGEMAVRLSIGASRRQLVGQLLTESCLLAVLGGLAGLLVARWTLAGIGMLLPPQAAETIAYELSGTALLFAAGLSLATGVLFGLFPAIHATRPDLLTTLKGTSGQPSGARSATRFRTTLATVQIALSMALLMSAGLFTKSLMNVSRVDLGLDVEQMITFGISPELNAYTPDQSRQLFETTEAALAAIPGVSAVTASMVPALSGSNWGSDVRVEGFEAGPDTDRNARYNEVGPGYFRTMGMVVMAGREFTDADALGAPRVAIINEAFAAKFNLGRDAVGRRMSSGASTDLDTEIIGIVQNAKYSDVKQEVPPLFFRPYRQNVRLGSLNFYVRTAMAPEPLLTSIQPAMARLDPNLPVVQLKTMPQQVRENVFMDRMITTLSSAFAVLATLLAAVGLYGVLAYTVAQRTREIGLRMALGADAARVRGMLLGQVGKMTVVGGLIGLAAAVGIGTAARSQLFEIEGYDPVVMAISAVLLAFVAMLAGLIPALKASRIDPMIALRYE
ncbi:MAG: ABC transporter permease [Vicinamibacterales bacterium]|nr:ABC transporter permease [Vicinamibacterales bacterium]